MLPPFDVCLIDLLTIIICILCCHTISVICSLISVFSIKCYVCNSGYKYAGEDCLDIQKLKAGDYLKECADEEIKDRVPNGTYKYCRVFSQTGKLAFCWDLPLISPVFVNVHQNYII